MDLTLSVGQVVLLDTPKGSRLKQIVGEVLSQEGNLIKISISEPECAGLKEGAALASFPDPLGVVRAEVKLEMGPESKLLILEIVHIHERQQRRSYVRARTQCRVAVAMAAKEFGKFEIIEGVSIDLSRGGLRAQLTQELPLGSIVNLVLELNGQKVNTLARVLGSKSDHEARFEFLYVPEDGVEHIVSRVMSAALSSPGARKIGKPGVLKD